MNLLNQEICAIKHTIAHLRKGMVLEPNSSRKEQMRRDIKQLNDILENKLNECEDYKG